MTRIRTGLIVLVLVVAALTVAGLGQAHLSGPPRALTGFGDRDGRNVSLYVRSSGAVAVQITWQVGSQNGAPTMKPRADTWQEDHVARPGDLVRLVIQPRPGKDSASQVTDAGIWVNSKPVVPVKQSNGPAVVELTVTLT